MGRSQETFSKKENTKKKLQKQKEKEQRREERRQAAASNKGKSLDDMLAYVDEYGNITETPPDPTRVKKPISADEILISTPKMEDMEEEDSLRKGRIAYFNHSKGYGFISDTQNGERIFVHINDLTEPVEEEDRVEFMVSKGPKGLQATSVKKLP